MFREKKTFMIYSDNFYDIITGTKDIEIERKSELEDKKLKIVKQGDNWLWSIEVDTR